MSDIEPKDKAILIFRIKKVCTFWIKSIYSIHPACIHTYTHPWIFFCLLMALHHIFLVLVLNYMRSHYGVFECVKHKKCKLFTIRWKTETVGCHILVWTSFIFFVANINGKTYASSNNHLFEFPLQRLTVAKYEWMEWKEKNTKQFIWNHWVSFTRFHWFAYSII